MGCSPWGHKESDTAEGLTHIHTIVKACPCYHLDLMEGGRIWKPTFLVLYMDLVVV